MTTSYQMKNKLFKQSKEHFLLGIKGTVRRNCDTHIIHTNLDTDVVVTQEDQFPTHPSSNDQTFIPIELFNILERLCLGRRRVFFQFEGQQIITESDGVVDTGLDGWITVRECQQKIKTCLKFDAQNFERTLIGKNGQQKIYMSSTAQIENLRPKSPSASGDKK